MRTRLTFLAAALASLATALAAAATEPGGTGCDPIDPAACMLPFPNDYFTKADPSTVTGRRINFGLDAMPRNRAGKPIAPEQYNASDGFSPGSAIILKVPGLDTLEDFRASNLPPIDDPERSLADDSPVVVLDADTGERQLVWAEIDANAALGGAPQDTVLIIRPAKNFLEGHRIIVGLRGLRADGAELAPPAAFRALVAGDGARGEHLRESVLAPLAAAGVSDPYLAWDFTVASADSTAGRMLHIRDQAFAELGDTNLQDGRVAGRAPVFRVHADDPLDRSQTAEADGIRDFKPCSAGDPARCEAGEHRWTARRIKGAITVPCFLDTPGCTTGGRFAISPLNGLPVRIPGNTTAQTFTCQVPHSAFRKPGEHRAGIYGHGLFGTQGELGQDQIQFFGDEHGFVWCAVDWKGMSTYDVPNAAVILQDVSRFDTLVDHTQQGYLGQLYLARLLKHPHGFHADPAFRTAAGEPLFSHEHVFYDGNSQGGIYGGALTAIAPDFTRATLGVPGMNYSTLLTRSVDFDMYAEGEFGTDTPLGLYDNYPSLVERQLIISIIQMLWDRADPNGYAQHMTSDPLPNTPPHEVLLQVGFGDHQVADVTTEVQARTIGARVHRDVLEAGRPRYSDRPYPDAPMPEVFQGVESAFDGFTGSVVTFWDVGAERNPPPPAANVPPRTGRDPHEDPRRTFSAIRMKSEFLKPDGRYVDTCLGPCFTRGTHGVPGL